jgi:hypothetical protein
MKTETNVSEPLEDRLVKIGELLIGVGALSTGDLTEAIQIAKRMGVPIGRVLVMSGCVTENNLQQALELQSLIKDGMVDRQTGEAALKIVLRERVDLQKALKKLNWVPAKDASSNKLGDLLVDSTIVTRQQLDSALEASFQSGMPLGGTLVLQGVVSAQMLPTVLHIQEQIRENKLPRDAAIDELKRALMFWARAEQSKQESLQSAQAQAASSAPPMMVPPNADGRRAATAAPPPPIPPQSPPFQPGPAPGTAASSTSSVPPDNVSLIELLKLSGFCTQADVDDALQQALVDSRLVSKMLLAIGFVDATTLNRYIHIQALITRGKLRADQALYVLNSMRNRNLTLEKALGELGVSPEL